MVLSEQKSICRFITFKVFSSFMIRYSKIVKYCFFLVLSATHKNASIKKNLLLGPISSPTNFQFCPKNNSFKTKSASIYYTVLILLPSIRDTRFFSITDFDRMKVANGESIVFYLPLFFHFHHQL